MALDAVRKIVPPERLRLTRVQMVWPEIATARLRRVAWPAAVRGDTLSLDVRDNQWLHELTYLRAELLQRIQEAAPEAEIGQLRLRVGSVPEPWPEPPERPEVEPPHLPDEPSRETMDALHGIDDPGLRQIMANARMALSARLRR